MDVTLTQLRYFVEAAAQLSMTGAALRLNVAQSAVSAAIAQLERHVGTQFFIRQRSKGLVLTPAGELFVRDAQAILAQVEESIDHARGEHQSVAGRIRIACFSTLAPFLLPGVLTTLREDHPALKTEVIETDTAGCISALLTGQADVALCYDLDLPDAISRSVVDTVRPYVALPPDHKLAQSKKIQLSSLAEESFVLLDLPHTRDLMLSIARLGGREPDIRFRSASYETVRTFVARGLGYSILHQRPQHPLTYDGGRLAAVEIRDDVPELKTVLAHLKSHRPTARVRAVAQAVRQQIVAAKAARD
ncbi:LysR substrate-binding domain-containing protein [Paenarthrobacter sp. NCHU4564]|uniref:LysR substrate-binding domain-containing protein n=1 Tax=Paenarthrobacter sp. NCHU4564 TaxID=3451353 RepID=UPI003F9B3574